MPTQESAEFEDRALKFLKERWDPTLERRTIKFNGAEHSFDFVSNDNKYIGDAKYLSMRENDGVPHAKISTISEYVWLLEKTNYKNRFLIFGNKKNNEKVAMEWLRRYKTLTNVEFYFLNLKKKSLKKLN